MHELCSCRERAPCGRRLATCVAPDRCSGRSPTVEWRRHRRASWTARECTRRLSTSARARLVEDTNVEEAPRWCSRWPPTATGHGFQPVRRTAPTAASRVRQAVLRRGQGATPRPQRTLSRRRRVQEAQAAESSITSRADSCEDCVSRTRSSSSRPRRAETRGDAPRCPARRPCCGSAARARSLPHRVRELPPAPNASRAGWRRLDLERPTRPWRSKSQERNVRHVVAALVASGCRDCGERDPCVVEFDMSARRRAAYWSWLGGGRPGEARCRDGAVRGALRELPPTADVGGRLPVSRAGFSTPSESRTRA